MPGGRHIALAVLAVVTAAGARAADANVVRGVVFADADGDGRRSPSEPPVVGARVWLETRASAATDADGRFELRGLRGPKDMVWVSAPEGYSPTPTWRLLGSAATADVELELPLVPVSLAAPLTFVHVSDAHIGKALYKGHGRIGADDLRHSLSQAIDLEPPPAFVVMTGDLTNRETKAEIDEAASVLLDLGVPFVPVPGNHDWVSRGAHYRPVFGPPSYSFNAGGAHFVVLNDNWRRPPDLAFLARELATLSPAERDKPLIVFTHRPPEDHSLERLERLGVDALLTGHWHANRFVDHGSLRQHNVEPIVRGGIDFTPAGYRIMTLQDGRLTAVHRTIVESAQAAIVWPPETGCVPAGETTVLAAVQTSAREPVVRLAAGGAEAAVMSAAGGWTVQLENVALRAGDRLQVIVTSGGREVARAERAVAICESPVTLSHEGDWPQSQGGPGHRGATTTPIRPPLRGVWATPVGGAIHGGSPAVGAGLVIVGVSDLANGRGGGVVALDIATGAIRWRAQVGHAVRGTPAIEGSRVVFGSADGVVHGVDLMSGAPQWTVDLGEGIDDNKSVLIAAPTVADGVAYVGVIGRFAAIDVATGTIRWQDRRVGPTSKDLSTRAAATVIGDRVVASVGLGRDGLIAWDRRTGKRAWTLGKKVTNGINGSPVARDGSLWVTNAAGEVRRISAAGDVEWSRQLIADATGFSHSIAATPALAGDVLIVASQYRSVRAASANTGRPLWHLEVEPGAVHTAHNARTSRAVTASPLVTGDIVWIAAVDGTLRAADLTTGELLWSTALGAPLLAGAAPAGDALIVAGFDGVVRAFVHDSTAPPLRRPGSGEGRLFAIALLGAGLLGVLVLFVSGRRR